MLCWMEEASENAAHLEWILTRVQDSPLLTVIMLVPPSYVFIFPTLEFFSTPTMLSHFSPLTYVGSGLAGYFEAVSYGICEMI